MKTNVKATNKKERGITLIALVVTIVVLLILAGVTVNLLLDENGIIEKSKVAKIETRASQVEDEVGMWKQNNFISKESNQEQESVDEMLEDLISRKLLTEDEIDRNQELITIKKNDGTVVKEISYSSVTINISKTPATEKSRAVLLTVDSVDGLATIKNDEEFDNFINSLSEAQKKEIIRNGLIKDVNQRDSSANCTTFQDVLDYYKNQGEIEEATEEAFWYGITSEDIDYFLEDILMEYYYNEFTNQIECYTVTNPDNEASNTYIAKANGTYTFKIQDVVTGKIYTQKVEVTNVDTNAKYYIANIKESNIDDNTARVITKLATTKPIKLAEASYWCIALREKETDRLQTFNTAYIIYNGKKIDISSEIYEKNGYSYIKGDHIYYYLSNSLKNVNKNEFYSSEQPFIIEKDGIEYIGYAKVCNENY